MIGNSAGFKSNSAGRSLLGKLNSGARSTSTSAPTLAPSPAPTPTPAMFKVPEKKEAEKVTSPPPAKQEEAAKSNSNSSTPLSIGSNTEGKKLLGMLKAPPPGVGLGVTKKKKKAAAASSARVLNSKRNQGGASVPSDGATDAKKGIMRAEKKVSATVAVTPGILGGSDLLVLGTVPPPSNKKKPVRATNLTLMQPMVSPLLGPTSNVSYGNDVGAPSLLGLDTTFNSRPKVVFSVDALLSMRNFVPYPKAPRGFLQRFDFDVVEVDGYGYRGAGSRNDFGFSNGDYHRGQRQTPPMMRPGYDRHTPPRGRHTPPLKQTNFMDRNTPPRQRNSPGLGNADEQTWTRGLAVDPQNNNNANNNAFRQQHQHDGQQQQEEKDSEGFQQHDNTRHKRDKWDTPLMKATFETESNARWSSQNDTAVDKYEKDMQTQQELFEEERKAWRMDRNLDTIANTEDNSTFPLEVDITEEDLRPLDIPHLDCTATNADLSDGMHVGGDMDNMAFLSTIPSPNASNPTERKGFALGPMLQNIPSPNASDRVGGGGLGGLTGLVPSSSMNHSSIGTKSKDPVSFIDSLFTGNGGGGGGSLGGLGDMDLGGPIGSGHSSSQGVGVGGDLFSSSPPPPPFGDSLFGNR